MPHANIDTLRAIDEAQTRGDLEAFFSNFTDDVKIHIRGNNKLSGDYEGKQSFQELFGRFGEAAGSNYSFEGHAYLADDEHGVSLQVAHYEKDGRTMDAQEAFIVHFRDGKVSEIWFASVDGGAFDAWIGR
jgi:ketosteroid isomerase-like protein